MDTLTNKLAKKMKSSDALKGVKENLSILGMIASLSFTGGVILGSNFIGPASDVGEIRSDIRGVICMMNSQQNNVSSTHCEVFFSTETREFLSIIRGNFSTAVELEEVNDIYFLPSNIAHLNERRWVFN